MFLKTLQKVSGDVRQKSSREPIFIDKEVFFHINVISIIKEHVFFVKKIVLNIRAYN
jgi:hypothetical protein